MNKRVMALVIAVILSMSSIPVFAATVTSDSSYSFAAAGQVEPNIYRDNITVTKNGGAFQVGFVTLVFPKNFLDNLPATFSVAVYAKNGEAGVEINPDTPQFNRNVHILVQKYKGMLYDVETGENSFVSIKSQHIVAKHFSWYRFR